MTFAFSMFLLPVESSDWPACKKDELRSSITEDELTFPLRLAWQRHAAQMPRPAWNDPLLEPGQLDFAYTRDPHAPVILDFDYAPQPVVAGGLVIWGSSADDSLRAVDAASGEERWRFIAGGPIRFAPHADKGRCFFASDDGFVYCLELATGKLIWKFRAASNVDQIPGNGRMISRWPLRSGVVVKEDTVYVTAGMWPSEGVFIYALRAADGGVIWCNDTSSVMNHRVRVAGSYAITGVAPQGYMIVQSKYLVVATGRSIPATFDRRNGKLLWFKNTAYQDKFGGVWMTTDPRTGMICFGQHTSRIHDGSGYRPLHAFKPPLRGQGGTHTFKAERVLVSNRAYFHVQNGVVRRAPAFRKPYVWTSPFRGGRAHSIALAADTLLVGGDKGVWAYDAGTSKERWHAIMDGQVRGLAVSDGRLIATTTRGTVYCFQSARETEDTAQPIVHKPPGFKSKSAQPAAWLNDLVARQKITKGYGLIIGKDSARIAEQLVSATGLHFVCLMDEARVDQARHRLTTKTNLHGSRISIQPIPSQKRLPFSDHLFNLIVVEDERPSIQADELYRVLRPCGGVLCFSNDSQQNKQILTRGKKSGDKLVTRGNHRFLVRGKLPGAFDWNSENRADMRVKWPLELRWFGPPGPSRTAQGGPAPRAANGRFFVVGRHHVIALDAYNGTELWSRILPYSHRNGGRLPKLPGPATRRLLQSLSANDDSVFLRFGKVVFELDAQTGEQKQVFGEFAASESFSLDKEHTFQFEGEPPEVKGDSPKPDEADEFEDIEDDLDVGPENETSITVAANEETLKFTLSLSSKITEKDYWELFFDFRRTENRNNLYEPGVFHLLVRPHAGKYEKGIGPLHPNFGLSAEAEGMKIQLSLTWQEIENVFGHRPPGFAFAAALNQHSEDRYHRRRLFTSELAYAFNDGWAEFGKKDAKPVRPKPRSRNELPPEAFKWARMPPLQTKWKTFKRDDAIGSFSRARQHPLSGKETERGYERGKGCGGRILSGSMDIMRSGTLSFYDFDDDSGMRYFGGLRPSCTVSMIPALGVLFANEGSNYCNCSYNYKCSVALGPARRQRNEDWALFADNARLETFFKGFAINIGAPGDRRDKGRRLWLQYPRPPVHSRLSMQIPMRIQNFSGGAAYRLNADRVAIKNTDRPWIYASGYRGIQKLDLDLFPNDGRSAMTLPCDTAPVIDGKLSEPCWDEVSALRRNGIVTLRHDDKNLYFAYRRNAIVDRRGNRQPWKQNTIGEDENVWEDHSFEVFLSTSADGKSSFVHLGVSASDATYDARWTSDDEWSAEDVAAENPDWNGKWSSAARATEEALTIEVAVPWKTLSDAGLPRDRIAINIKSRGKLIGSPVALQRIITKGTNFLPLIFPKGIRGARTYNMKLHFCETEDVKPGDRVFDIKLQGQTVLKDFDIVKAAGGNLIALTREFTNIQADRSLSIEFVTRTEGRHPILSGFELDLVEAKQ